MKVESYMLILCRLYYFRISKNLDKRNWQDDEANDYDVLYLADGDIHRVE